MKKLLSKFTAIYIVVLFSWLYFYDDGRESLFNKIVG